MIIGAGTGRTGTLSMKSAFETLGFGPCHHMEEVLRHPSEIGTWERAARGRPVDWAAFMGRWGSCVDFPSALYWRELREAFPEARVVLTVREPEDWFASINQTIRAVWRPWTSRLVARHLPILGAPHEVTFPHPVGRAVLVGSKAEAIAAYLEHNAAVRREVPDEQLLVFEVAEGWGPLCDFLGVDVPHTAFPRRNDRDVFLRRARVVGTLSALALLVPPVTIAVGAWVGARALGRRLTDRA
ncbi:MAG: sulfotransferase family protein [Myxococcota bacterium]